MISPFSIQFDKSRYSSLVRSLFYGLCIFWSLIDETIDHVIVTLANNFLAFIHTRSLTNFILFLHIFSHFPCGNFDFQTFDFFGILNLRNFLNALNQHIFHINLSPSNRSKKQFIALWQSFSFPVTRQRMWMYFFLNLIDTYVTFYVIDLIFFLHWNDIKIRNHLTFWGKRWWRRW